MTDEEARVLAWTLLGEAGGEGASGMAAVAHVIRNRSNSSRFPSNPAVVALQKSSSGIHQFSTWNSLGMGGNLPRAQYPVGSSAFEQALKIVNEVFGATPGKDPTKGATHYYSPKGMPNGAAPYWWNSEARHGEVKVGGHIFAAKESTPKVAPTPATRMVQSLGKAPTQQDLNAFKLGGTITGRQAPTPAAQSLTMAANRTPKVAQQEQVFLPSIGTTGRVAPTPAKQSDNLAVARAAGSNVTLTAVLDPVTNTFKPVTEVQRPTGTTAKQAQTATSRVAGFAVPGGTAGIAAVERAKQLSAQVPSYAGMDAAKPKTSNAQTQFKNPSANGTTNNGKPQDRLTTNPQAAPTLMDTKGRSRDSVDQALQGKKDALGVSLNVVAPPKPARVAPVPMEPILRMPVPVPQVPSAPLKIVVQRDPAPIAKVIALTPVDQLRQQGYSPADAYDLANAQAAERARDNASSPAHQSSNDWFNEVTGR